MKKSMIVGGVAIVALCAMILPRIFTKKTFSEGVADPVVEVTKSEIRDIKLTTGLVGQVEPEDVVYVYPKASGEVTEVNIKAGEVVEAGEIICVIDTKQVESAKSTLDAAELALRQAQEELSRQSILYAGGGISQQAYQQYQDSVESAQISYDSAKTEYENQVSYSQITAPISGLVELCNIEVFDQVSQTDQICVISGQSAKVVSFSITERIRGYLREGDDMSVEKDGNSYDGKIIEVSTMADSDTGLFKVKARLNGTMDELVNLPTGSRVKLYVISEHVEDVMAIPVDAVYYDGGLSYVYTYDPETSSLHKVQVETGLYDSEWIEIKSGIDADDYVVTTWSSELYEGTTVRLKEETEETNETTADTADIATAGNAVSGGVTIETLESQETENQETESTEASQQP